MLGAIALLVLFAAALLVADVIAPHLTLELKKVRWPERLFGQTPALQKLYAFAKQNDILFVRDRDWGAGLKLGAFVAPNVITVGKHISCALARKGMEEAAFAHELGHLRLFREKEEGHFKCSHKGFDCLIDEELAAWREGLIILKDLGIRVNEREYWKFAAFSLMSHIIVFSRTTCDEVFKERCPLNPAIYFSEVGPPFERLFRNKSEPSILRILENVYARYEVEEAIIQ